MFYKEARFYYKNNGCISKYGSSRSWNLVGYDIYTLASLPHRPPSSWAHFSEGSQIAAHLGRLASHDNFLLAFFLISHWCPCTTIVSHILLFSFHLLCFYEQLLCLTSPTSLLIQATTTTIWCQRAGQLWQVLALYWQRSLRKVNHANCYK